MSKGRRYVEDHVFLPSYDPPPAELKNDLGGGHLEVLRGPAWVEQEEP